MTRRRGAPPHERACRLGAGCRCARPPPGSPLRSDPAPRGAGGDLDPVSAHRRGAITGSRPRPATQLARHDHDENRPGRLHLSKARFWSERWGPPHTADEIFDKKDPVRSAYEPVTSAPVRETQPSPILDGSGTSRALPTRPEGWPQPLRPVAYPGIIGDVVQALGPHTEADPTALLIQMLTMFGNVVGRTAHFTVEGDTHFLNLDVVMVGTSSKSRKGTSLGRCRHVFADIDTEWISNCLASGLSSGEGLVWSVRDPIEKEQPIKEDGRVVDYQTVIEDAGITDKRLLVMETEFASTLRVLGREGNTLSPNLRNAWDGNPLRSMTKNSPARATGAHISLVGHITKDELTRYLDRTESGNGFGNRILWLCVQRSKYLPEGGGMVDMTPLQARLRQAVEYARAVGEMRRNDAARDLWHREYPRLTADVPGLLGAMTGRAEAQTMRLACLMALSEMSSTVTVTHLAAALELWRYCFDSVRFIFGDSLGDPTADEILRELKQNEDGLTLTDISNKFGRNKPAGEIRRALGLLQDLQFVRRAKDHSAVGRPKETFYLGSAAAATDERF